MLSLFLVQDVAHIDGGYRPCVGLNVPSAWPIGRFSSDYVWPVLGDYRGFFVIEHTRRKILHLNVTRHPSADWVVQQLRDTFPEAGSHRYVILDRDAKFDASVTTFLTATGLKSKRTAVRAPWQNGTAERWIGSCRRELLDHIIALNERHLLRLLRDYLRYYHQERIHDSLEKDTPESRPIERKPKADATVISLPRLGGLHHRYTWREAA